MNNGRNDTGMPRARVWWGVRLGMLSWVLLSACMVHSAGKALNLTFNGTLTENKCVIVDASGLSVTLPSLALKDFTYTSRTPVTPFTITLKDCTAAVANKSVKMTFVGGAEGTQVDGGVTYLKSRGNTGMLVGLQDGAGHDVSVGKPVDAGVVSVTGTGNQNHYTLGAYGLLPAGVEVKPGQYVAVATFTVDYQ